MSENLVLFKQHGFVCQGEACACHGSAAVNERLAENHVPAEEMP
jgi:NADH:ubiquinone oxidoreductase subunit E